MRSYQLMPRLHILRHYEDELSREWKYTQQRAVLWSEALAHRRQKCLL